MIVQGKYCDSINKHLERGNKILYQVIEKKDSSLSVSAKKLTDLEVINDKQTIALVTIQQEVAHGQTTVKRLREQKTLLVIALGVVVILAIL